MREKGAISSRWIKTPQVALAGEHIAMACLVNNGFAMQLSDNFAWWHLRDAEDLLIGPRYCAEKALLGGRAQLSFPVTKSYRRPWPD